MFIRKSSAVLAILFAAEVFARASVSISAATNGTGISADTAGSGGTGAWTTLGAITLTEGNKMDIDPGNVTLIITAPAGFEFNTALTPSATFSAAMDITSASASISSPATLTVSISVADNKKNDVLTVGATGLQIRPTFGGPLSTGKHLYRSASNPGTASISGITTSSDGSTGSNFGNVSTVAGAYNRLQLLLPGETPAPGTVSGRSGTPNTPIAGTAFNVTVNAVDAFWNPVTTILNLISFSSTDPAATLPGLTALAGGTKTLSVTLQTAGIQTITATDTLDGSKAPDTTTPVQVGPGAATKLIVITQPSATATAGVPFAQQPAVLIQDAYGNTRINDTTAIIATRLSGVGNLLGTTNLNAVGGIATYTNLAHSVATNITIRFTSGSLTAATSSVVTVTSGPFARLLALLPGETNAPGTVTGRSGSSAAIAGSNTLVRVLATDAYFNPIAGVSDNVGITSADAFAILPGSAPLVNGTNTYGITFKSAGSQNVIATDLTNGARTPATNTISVSAGAFVKLLLLVPGETAAPNTANGKTGAPTTQTAGIAFNTTVNGVDSFWNTVTSLSGASFTMHLASTDTNATFAADANLASGTVTMSVTLRRAGSWTITASDVDDGTKTSSTSPPITANVGSFTKLQTLLPGETAVPGSSTGKTGTPATQTAGTPFAVTVNSVDANWNLISTNDTVRIFASDTNAVLPANAALIAGAQTFSLTLKSAGSRTVTASNITHATIGGGTSSAVAINPAAYARLQVLMPGETAAPGTVNGKTGAPTARTAGTAFTTLTVSAVDTNWNVVPTNVTVAITSSDPNATLPANTALGTSGTKNNFSATFKTAGLETISATDASDLTKTNTGTATLVVAGAIAKLQLLVPGETAAPGTTTGKTGTPLSQNVSVPFNITVNSVDANWNVYSTNDIVRIVSSDPSAVLPANAPLAIGTRSFSFTFQTPGTNLTITASNVTHTAMPASVSPLVTVIAPPAQSGGAIVAIHDSELTRALEQMTATPPTPNGAGTSGKEWWQTNWHYFVMPESLKEALRSDGTAFEIVSDADIAAGKLMDTNGHPRYPIMISLASEAVRDDEIAPLTNYVAAGGFLFVGSSSFTRNTNGTARGDFAIGNAMGVHCATPGLTNWRANQVFVKQNDHRIVAHLPSGLMYWEMANNGDEISWGSYPHPSNPYPSNLVWRVTTSNATSLIAGEASPCLLTKSFGNGQFIYDASMQPLIGHGGWAPGTAAYLIFRKSIEWAFDTSRRPLPKISPWPFEYNTAVMVRHDLENYRQEIAAIEASAQIEAANGLKGEYYFCTGTLRDEMFPSYNTNTVIQSLRRAISNYNAVIGPHNGGLRNPNNSPALSMTDYDYWHWGPDEALNVTPAGYDSGKAYALASVSNAFVDIEGWLPGQMTSDMRVWVAPYFNSTREDSYDIQAQLGVKVAGDQKLTSFPHWTVSTGTSGKRYPFLSIPVSDWFVGNTVAQAMEAGHTTNSLHAGVDYYYSQGLLVNFYSHTLSTGLGQVGALATDYVGYAGNTNLHPRIWPVNCVDLYNWWLQRSNAQITVNYQSGGSDSTITKFNITGATATNTAVELLLPGTDTVLGLQVFTNGVAAGSSSWRTNGQLLKVLVGNTVTNAEVRYILAPQARDDAFAFASGPLLSVPAPGVIANDVGGAGGSSLSAFVVTPPTNGSVTMNTNGSFTYIPDDQTVTVDSFTYRVSDGVTNSAPASVLLTNANPAVFSDDFIRGTDPGSLAPWIVRAGNWTVTSGELRTATNTLHTYANVYLTGSWLDYQVEGRIRFPAGAFGGGIGGRLDPVSGKHYSVWLYPEGSIGGALTIKLIKFSNWTTWTLLQSASVASVGTNWHVIDLGFQGSQISVALDGVQKLSAIDSDYTQGGISFDMWTDDAPYVMAADYFNITPLAAEDQYSLLVNTTLNVSAPGVLANDSEAFPGTLQAAVVSSPEHGFLLLSSDGSFSYTPDQDYIGTDAFIYQASHGSTNLGTAWVILNVNADTNPPPVPVIQSLQISNSVATLSFSSVIGRTYRLQYKTNVGSASWVDVPPDIIAADTTAFATDTVIETQRFYRVLLLP